ncbi:unnamed protein product [Diabrotica balteata]|uniref:dihydrofolate reductase n=1 Tax=Diabrotica balteata TaxID=107213 RepID=A0A9N9X9L3_DIABA|nr:unnamed protein product [Diabrotica balteata]
MVIKLNLIAAASENMGIGKNNNLPWRLQKEMEYFTRMTSTTNDPNKKNVVIMGRKTWDSIPKKYKPLNNRINMVLSRSELDLSRYTDVFSFTSLSSCLKRLEEDDFKTKYESVWVIGGSSVYQETMKSENFYRLYLTRILKDFECDTFFPELPKDLEKVTDPAVPEEKQSENNIDYTFNVYQNTIFQK